MADVRLDFYDLDADALPDVCMRCGGPATVRPVKQFAWLPYWARFMPWFVQIAMTKRRRVPVPLCDQHKNHWTIRYLVGLGGLGLLLLLLIGGGVLFGVGQDDNPGGPLSIFGMLLLACGGVLLLVWLVALIALAVTQINATEITNDTIALKNVHAEFAQAYREQTQPSIAPEVDEVIRDQWGRPTGGRRADRDEPRRGREDYPPDDQYRRGR